VSEFEGVGGLNEFPEGRIRRRSVNGREIAVALWQGRFYAFSNRCPHADFQLHFGYIEENKVHCPIHFAEFELATGKAVYGPEGVADLPVFQVKVEEGEVRVAVPEADEG
jgi:nitrite reductase/ring-hydroxylating ferredoxin subunit